MRWGLVRLGRDALINSWPGEARRGEAWRGRVVWGWAGYGEARHGRDLKQGGGKPIFSSPREDCVE